MAKTVWSKGEQKSRVLAPGRERHSSSPGREPWDYQGPAPDSLCPRAHALGYGNAALTGSLSSRLRRIAPILCGLLFLSPTASAQHIPRPLLVNPDHHGLPVQPSFDVQSDGSVRFVWNAYENHRERLYTTSFKNGRRSRTQILSPEDGVYWMPQYVADGENSGWAVWQTRRDGVWRIEGRRLEDGFWEPVVLLSEKGKDALIPAATMGRDGLLVAWEDHSVEPQRIVLRYPDGTFETKSDGTQPCYRPDIVAASARDHGVGYDCYDGLHYGFPFGERRQYGPLEEMSAVFSEEDAYTGVAWISEQSVIGKGAIDQRHRIIFSTFSHSHRQDIEVADLSHSLLSRLEPDVGPIWGFAGRRLHPMPITDRDGPVWILWERKIQSDGRSTDPGELLAATILDDKVVTRPVILHTGLVRYDVPSSGLIRDGKLLISGFDPTHNLIIQEIDLSAVRDALVRGEEPDTVMPPAEELELTGWEPIDLPLTHWGYDNNQRPSIEIDGETHYLWWGDLHVHSTLTADAEGEVDELMHYARDKAKIDVIVMQENDASSWLDSNDQGAYRNQVLTDSEYALSVYFSRKYTEPGRFVALPGWEWSDRTDDGNANHRTAIFAGDTAPMIRHTEEDDFEALCDLVEAAGGVMNSQHPTFRLVDRPCEGNIEVAAGWGVYINQPEKIHADLTAGYKVGFVATSDGHRRNPGVGGGLTGFWAPELTSEAIMQAMKDHKVYATNGSRLVMHARANGSFMGEDVETSGEVELTLDARSPKAAIVRAVLVRDGDEIFSAPGDGLALQLTHLDTPAAGFHWYYWRVELEGESPDYPGNIKVAEGHLGWTSPHRVAVR